MSNILPFQRPTRCDVILPLHVKDSTGPAFFEELEATMLFVAEQYGIPTEVTP